MEVILWTYSTKTIIICISKRGVHTGGRKPVGSAFDCSPVYLGSNTGDEQN